MAEIFVFQNLLKDEVASRILSALIVTCLGILDLHPQLVAIAPSPPFSLIHFQLFN